MRKPRTTLTAALLAALIVVGGIFGVTLTRAQEVPPSVTYANQQTSNGSEWGKLLTKEPMMRIVVDQQVTFRLKASGGNFSFFVDQDGNNKPSENEKVDPTLKGTSAEIRDLQLQANQSVWYKTINGPSQLGLYLKTSEPTTFTVSIWHLSELQVAPAPTATLLVQQPTATATAAATVAGGATPSPVQASATITTTGALTNTNILTQTVDLNATANALAMQIIGGTATIVAQNNATETTVAANAAATAAAETRGTAAVLNAAATIVAGTPTTIPTAAAAPTADAAPEEPATAAPAAPPGNGPTLADVAEGQEVSGGTPWGWILGIGAVAVGGAAWMLRNQIKTALKSRRQPPSNP